MRPESTHTVIKAYRFFPSPAGMSLTELSLAGDNQISRPGRVWLVGGFTFSNLFSNLMGIKRRMLDIGKKITIYFLQYVKKCTVFFVFGNQMENVRYWQKIT
jgi:hypothetical protein